MQACHQDVLCQCDGNGGAQMDGKRHSLSHSGHILVSSFLSLLRSHTHTLCFGSMIGVCGLMPSGTCSVHECGLTDGEVEG